jgi:hypothetical protein
MFFGEDSVGLEHQLDRLAKIAPGLLQSGSLGISAWKLLDEGPVAFWDFTIDGRQLQLHAVSLDKRYIEYGADPDV